MIEQRWRDCTIEIHLDGGIQIDRAVMEKLLDRNTSRWRVMERQSRQGETAVYNYI